MYCNVTDSTATMCCSLQLMLSYVPLVTSSLTSFTVREKADGYGSGKANCSTSAGSNTDAA